MKHKKPAAKKHVEVRHVEPVHHQGAANHREVKSGASTGTTLGRHVTSAPSEPANDSHSPEMDAVKQALFQHQSDGGSSGNGDNVPRPGVSDRDFASMPVDAPNQAQE